MSGISRVLCAVDIDDAAGSAFAQALAVARARQAALLLVCAVPPGQPFNQRAADRVARLLKLRREAEAAGVDVRVSVQSGEPAEIVVLHAHARRADLIVISVEHGRADGRPWGAVAEDVLRAARCPTLIVPAGAPSRPAFGSLLCAVALSPDFDMPLETVLSVADPHGYRLTVLHVANGRGAGPAALKRVQALIPPAAEPVARARVAAGGVVREIEKAVRAVDADLVVIGARPRNRISRRLFGVTRQLLTTSRHPVLAVPLQAAVEKRDERRAA